MYQWRCDIKGIWCRQQNVTFYCCVYSIYDQKQTGSGRAQGVCRQYAVQKVKINKKNQRRHPTLFMRDWCRDGHLLLILQTSVHPSERELVITGPQGVCIEYCFREWLTWSCFVFAKWETSKEDCKNQLQMEVLSVMYTLSRFLYLNVTSIVIIFFMMLDDFNSNIKPKQKKQTNKTKLNAEYM